MNEIETVSANPTRGALDGYIHDPANGFTGSAGSAEFVREPMPEGLAKIINYLDGPLISAPTSISAPATIAESATHERDFVDEHHRMLLFAGFTTLLLLIFRVHN